MVPVRLQIIRVFEGSSAPKDLDSFGVSRNQNIDLVTSKIYDIGGRKDDLLDACKVFIVDDSMFVVDHMYNTKNGNSRTGQLFNLQYGIKYKE